jgi:hypothetical protein
MLAIAPEVRVVLNKAVLPGFVDALTKAAQVSAQAQDKQQLRKLENARLERYCPLFHPENSPFTNLATFPNNLICSGYRLDSWLCYMGLQTMKDAATHS